MKITPTDLQMEPTKEEPRRIPVKLFIGIGLGCLFFIAGFIGLTGLKQKAEPIDIVKAEAACKDIGVKKISIDEMNDLYDDVSDCFTLSASAYTVTDKSEEVKDLCKTLKLDINDPSSILYRLASGELYVMDTYMISFEDEKKALVCFDKLKGEDKAEQKGDISYVVKASPKDDVITYKTIYLTGNNICYMSGADTSDVSVAKSLITSMCKRLGLPTPSLKLKS